MEERKNSRATGSVFGYPISLVLLGIIFFAAAANSQRPLSVFMASTLLLMLAVRLWNRLSLVRLAAELSVDRDRLFPGEKFSLRAEIRNGKFLPVRIRLALPGSGALVPVSGGTIGDEARVLPFERITGTWEYRAERRGVFRPGPAVLTAGDPLGLGGREKTVGLDRDIIVYPRIVRIEELPLPFREFFGIRPSKGIIEDPARYEGTREYTENRPARNIHWKISARFGIPREKIFEPTSRRKVFFLLNGSGFLRDDDTAGFETALEIIASLAYGLAETDASIAAATDRIVRGYPSSVPLGRGPEHLGKILELLSRCGLENGEDAPSFRIPGSAGAGLVVVSRKSDDVVKLPDRTVPLRRDRLLFVFSEAPAAGETAVLPSICFRELLPDDTDLRTGSNP